MSELDNIEEIADDLCAHSANISHKQREAAKKFLALGRKKPKWMRQLRALRGHRVPETRLSRA